MAPPPCATMGRTSSPLACSPSEDVSHSSSRTPFLSLCPVSYVTWTMSYVLCPMSYVLCPMSYVLCPMSHSIPLPMSCVLCPLSYCLCPLSCVLRPMSYGFCNFPYWQGGNEQGPMGRAYCRRPSPWPMQTALGGSMSSGPALRTMAPSYGFIVYIEGLAWLCSHIILRHVQAASTWAPARV